MRKRYRRGYFAVLWIVALLTLEASLPGSVNAAATSTRGQSDETVPRLANHCFEPPTAEPEEPVLVPCQDWQREGGSIDVPSIRGGHHLYEFIASAGCSVTFSFCQHGGDVNYDSGLSIWDAAAEVQFACNVDACDVRSEVTWTPPSDGVYLLRIGGMMDVSIGQYTLAYQGCAPCSEETSVEGVSWGLVKRLLR